MSFEDRAVGCHLQIDVPTTYISPPSFDTPHIFAFVLSETWHFYWQDLKGNDKVNQKFAYVIPIMLDSPAM